MYRTYLRFVYNYLYMKICTLRVLIKNTYLHFTILHLHFSYFQTRRLYVSGNVDCSWEKVYGLD